MRMTRATDRGKHGQARDDLVAGPMVSSVSPPKLVHTASVMYLNLLPNSILDKLVHLLAQVCNKGLGPQGTSGLLPFLQLFLQ